MIDSLRTCVYNITSNDDDDDDDDDDDCGDYMLKEKGGK